MVRARAPGPARAGERHAQAGSRSRWTISPRTSIKAGQLSTAAALLAEGERIDPGIRAATLPYVLRFAGGSAVSDPTRINRRGMAVMDYNSRSWWCPSLTWTSYGSFASFSDPDGNGWLLQEITTRLPGR